MAELLECLLCGYKTVRCGMTNHLKAKHPEKYPRTGYFRIEDFTKSLGTIKCKDLKTFVKTLNKK